jgi:transcriptional regulator with PAS, ATPase and Fis domain
MQVKILRAIQTKRITRVGADTETPIDVRIISASNVDLWELVKKEKFREDLYYRINVISIHIPPLRERLEDIEVLTDFILHKMEERYRQNIYVTKDAIARLKSYDWPGNVRELENVLERSFVIAQTNGTNKITRKEISDYLEMLGFDELQHSFNDQADLKHEDPEQKPSKILKRTEGEIIKKTLSEKKGNVKATAQALGISRNTLYRKMKQLGIEPDRSLYR